MTEHHGLDAATVRTIGFQVLNVSILVAGLIYLLKDRVRAYFKEKNEAFNASAKRAEQARLQAEDELTQIRSRLEKFGLTEDESLLRAQAEAADLKKQIIKEAAEASTRIREEAREAAQVEVMKAKNQIKSDLVQEAIKLARTQMAGAVSAEDHRRLQGNFISSIEGAHT